MKLIKECVELFLKGRRWVRHRSETPLYLYIERTAVSRWNQILTATRLPMARIGQREGAGKSEAATNEGMNERRPAHGEKKR